MDYVAECFSKFVKERFSTYRIGRHYYPEKPYSGSQHGQSAYLKTEADVQVKFGGYLESWLLEKHPGLIVHAELPIYSKAHQRADLTIHKVAAEDHWTTRQQIIDSLESVIEVKLANARFPFFNLAKGCISKDFSVLKEIPDHVKKYLLIIDEREGVESDHAKEILDKASLYNINVISNNPVLHAIN